MKATPIKSHVSQQKAAMVPSASSTSLLHLLSLFFFLFLLCHVDADIDPICAKTVSRNSTHKHLNKFLGYIR